MKWVTCKTGRSRSNRKTLTLKEKIGLHTQIQKNSFPIENLTLSEQTCETNNIIQSSQWFIQSFVVAKAPVIWIPSTWVFESWWILLKIRNGSSYNIYIYIHQHLLVDVGWKFWETEDTNSCGNCLGETSWGKFLGEAYNWVDTFLSWRLRNERFLSLEEKKWFKLTLTEGCRNECLKKCVSCSKPPQIIHFKSLHKFKRWPQKTPLEVFHLIDIKVWV